MALPKMERRVELVSVSRVRSEKKLRLVLQDRDREIRVIFDLDNPERLAAPDATVGEWYRVFIQPTLPPEPR